MLQSFISLEEIDSPKNLVTDLVTENTATVSWDPVQAVIDRYLVRYTSADGDTREVPVGKEQSSTVLTGLRPGVEYTVHVWAQKGDRESGKADTMAPTGNGACIVSGSLLSLGCFSFSDLGRKGGLRMSRLVSLHSTGILASMESLLFLPMHSLSCSVKTKIWSLNIDIIAH